MNLSELLRDSSDLLCSGVGRSLDSEYCCHAAMEVIGLVLFIDKSRLPPVTYQQFRDLLVEGGIETMSGFLFNDINIPAYSKEVNKELTVQFYQDNAQSVRFMYLNLLAEMLESEE